jgi:hypothetical protein
MRLIHTLCLAAFVLAGVAQPGLTGAPQNSAAALIISKPLGQITAMRRLSEAQYRNSIADIFGPDIKVAG